MYISFFREKNTMYEKSAKIQKYLKKSISDKNLKLICRNIRYKKRTCENSQIANTDEINKQNKNRKHIKHIA